MFFALLLLLCFVVGVGSAVIWYYGSKEEKRPRLAKVVALPLGCVALPVAGVVLLAFAGNLLQKSDEALAEEILGYPTTLTDDRMLFDDFGRGASREIYMRAEMTEAERNRLLSIPNAVPSEWTLVQFEARGAVKGFMWWVQTAPGSFNYCASARIRDAHGYNGWQEFRFAECLNAGTEFPQSLNKGYIYVIASGRKG